MESIISPILRSNMLLKVSNFKEMALSIYSWILKSNIVPAAPFEAEQTHWQSFCWSYTKFKEVVSVAACMADS